MNIWFMQGSESNPAFHTDCCFGNSLVGLLKVFVGIIDFGERLLALSFLISTNAFILFFHAI